MNNEAKVRKSTKRVVLGKGQGKVMSYEDIEEARATRAAKDLIKDKRQRGRKRKKNIMQEADDAETEPEVGAFCERGHNWQDEASSESNKCSTRGGWAKANARSGTHNRGARESTSGVYVLKGRMRRSRSL